MINPATVLHHELLYLPALAAYAKGNVALIGDAAHAMTPDHGKGACQALIDAVALARAMSSSEDVTKALRRYDAERRPPTQRMAAMSMRSNKLTQMRRHLAVRDMVVRAALFAGPPR